MAVLEEGKYLGKYKEGDIYYYQFKPEKIAVNGEAIYVRIGDRHDEFATNRSYMLSILNEEEQKLVNERISQRGN